MLKCLEKNPAHRYATPQELLRDLEALEAGKALSISGDELRRLRKAKPRRSGAAPRQSRVGKGLLIACLLSWAAQPLARWYFGRNSRNGRPSPICYNRPTMRPLNLRQEFPMVIAKWRMLQKPGDPKRRQPASSQDPHRDTGRY